MDAVLQVIVTTVDKASTTTNLGKMFPLLARIVEKASTVLLRVPSLKADVKCVVVACIQRRWVRRKKICALIVLLDA
jgi:hypothetical protein